MEATPDVSTVVDNTEHPGSPSGLSCSISTPDANMSSPLGLGSFSRYHSAFLCPSSQSHDASSGILSDIPARSLNLCGQSTDVLILTSFPTIHTIILSSIHLTNSPKEQPSSKPLNPLDHRASTTRVQRTLTNEPSGISSSDNP